MKYLNVKNVKHKIHLNGKQISKDGLYALNAKVDEYLDRICMIRNGSQKRIDAAIISRVGLK